MLEPASEQTVRYTAEDAIEELGFGCYQWKVMLLCCAFPVWLLVCCSFMTAKNYGVNTCCDFMFFMITFVADTFLFC